MFLPDRELVIFDLEFTDVALAETAGTYPQIIEIGAVKITDRLEVVDEFSTLVQPIALEQFTEYSEQITGIKRYELESAPYWKDIWREFAEFTKFSSRKLCSWGIAQDVAVLRRAYRLHKLGYPHSHLTIDALSLVYSFASTEELSMNRWSMNAVCEHFGIERGTKHRALADARDVVKILQAMVASEEEESEYKLIEF